MCVFYIVGALTSGKKFPLQNGGMCSGYTALKATLKKNTWFCSSKMIAQTFVDTKRFHRCSQVISTDAWTAWPWGWLGIGAYLAASSPFRINDTTSMNGVQTSETSNFEKTSFRGRKFGAIQYLDGGTSDSFLIPIFEGGAYPTCTTVMKKIFLGQVGQRLYTQNIVRKHVLKHFANWFPLVLLHFLC